MLIISKHTRFSFIFIFNFFFWNLWKYYIPGEMVFRNFGLFREFRERGVNLVLMKIFYFVDRLRLVAIICSRDPTDVWAVWQWPRWQGQHQGDFGHHALPGDADLWQRNGRTGRSSGHRRSVKMNRKYQIWIVNEFLSTWHQIENKRRLPFTKDREAPNMIFSL